MSTARIIKKYPNRRLYDTEQSRYITIADIKDLVLAEVRFVVIDTQSGDDLTRLILLQVINEHEQRGDAIMSQDFLSQIIRCYGNVVPSFMANYLEESLEFFLTEQSKKPLTSGP